MISLIRKTLFSRTNKNQVSPHIFLILCIFTVIVSLYTYLLFDAQGMLVRLILGITMTVVFVIVDQSRLSSAVTAYLSPTIIIALLIFAAIFFKGDGLIFYYVCCVAMISFTYFSSKGLALHIITVTAALAVLLFAFGINFLGQNYTTVYNIISFGASFGLCVIAYSFCAFSAKTLEALDVALGESKAANKAKSAFLSTMSHEIRTPMNAILGITEIELQHEELDPEVRKSLEKIYTSGDLLLGIINDILDLSKIEAGKLDLIIEDYQIASLINDTAQLNMMRIGSKPIEFEMAVDESIPAKMSGDELRVKQILNNVLSNAFKYTASGKVLLTVSAKPSDEGGDETVTLIVEVSDTGRGMTNEQVARLFDEYSRFNEEANRTTEGTGLGMGITRNLLRLMGGKIFIESEVGKGSTFTLHIPQGRVDDEVLGKEVAENLRSFRTSDRGHLKRIQISREPMPYGSVLVVDDVETNIYVARGLMTPYELKIDSAESGYEAIEILGSGRVYDVVFMDHMMPGMDGIEATKRIRDMGYGHPVVALTANAVAGQADIFLENGFDDFISKPIDVRQLNNILKKYIRDKQPPDVIDAARRNMAETEVYMADHDESRPDIDPGFAEVFLRDAKKSLLVLDSVVEKSSACTEEDIRSYIIHVHGMKSALANIGKTELSETAKELEQKGRDGDMEAILSGTPGFLEQLRAFVSELQPETDAGDGGGELSDTDRSWLLEKLQSIKASCEEYDEQSAEAFLKELRAKAWPANISELLETISENLLHSDFDEIVALISGFEPE